MKSPNRSNLTRGAPSLFFLAIIILLPNGAWAQESTGHTLLEETKALREEIKSLREDVQQLRKKLDEETTSIIFMGEYFIGRNPDITMRGLTIGFDNPAKGYFFTIGYQFPKTKYAGNEELPEGISLISLRELHIHVATNWLPLRINNFDTAESDFYRLEFATGFGFVYDWGSTLRITEHEIAFGVDMDIPDPDVDLSDGLGFQLVLNLTASWLFGSARCRVSIFDFESVGCGFAGGLRF